MSKFNENAEISLNLKSKLWMCFLQPLTDPFTEIFCDPRETRRNMSTLERVIKQFTGLIMN